PALLRRRPRLGLIGMADSLQGAAMNPVTLVGRRHAKARGGNSWLSVVVQLSMSLGVAAAGALLGGFTVPGAQGVEVLPAFRLTFLCIGGMALLAASIFLQLGRHDGSQPDRKSVV